MRIGFIGTGKIAGAVVEAICTSGFENYSILLSPRNEDRSKLLAKKFTNVKRLSTNQEVVDGSEIVFLALKPDVYPEVLKSLTFYKEQSVVSLIPFLMLNELEKLVSPASTLSRAIPLPTVTTHICPIPIYNPTAIVVDIFNRIGQPLVAESEEELHILWTLTCLITPYYELMGVMSSWTKDSGVETKLADRYTADLFHSLSHAAKISESPDFNLLASHAATPGGLNEKSAIMIKNAGAYNSFGEAADYILSLFKAREKQ